MQEISLMMPLLATYKHRQNVERESTVAKRLGVEPTALANYKKGERRMPDTAVAILADGLGFDLSDMIAAANIGLTKCDMEERQFWFKRIRNEALRKMAEENCKTTDEGKNTVRAVRQNKG